MRGRDAVVVLLLERELVHRDLAPRNPLLFESCPLCGPLVEVTLSFLMSLLIPIILKFLDSSNEL